MKHDLSKIARRLSLSVCIAACVAQVTSAQQPAASGTPAGVQGAQASLADGGESAADARRNSATPSQYRIGPMDVISIRVAAPDIVAQFSSDAVEVSECGTIPLLSVQNEEQSEIRAAGLTTLELQEQLRKFYTKYKRNPQVVVRVKEYNAQPVAVNGAVVRPGQFQMRRPVRLSEIIRRYAGGPTERAGGSVQLARMPLYGSCAEPSATTPTATSDDGIAFLVLDLNATLSGEEKSDPYLQPGDVVTLTEAKEAYVVGNVLRPGPVTLKGDRLTVSRAIAMAGGLAPDTKKEKVRIIRQGTSGGQQQEIYVDLRAVDKHQAEDIALLPNDIVDVPVAGGKRILRSLVGAVVPSVGQLPVRIIP